MFEKEIMKLLDDREQRALYQDFLLQSHPKYSLMVVKINYPGYDKNNHLTTYVVTKIYLQLIKRMPVLKLDIQSTSEGLIFYVMSDVHASVCKEIGIALEDSDLGRLVDIDVYDINRAYSRKDFNMPSRKCFICNDDAKVCGRSQKHTYEQIIEYIENIIIEDIFNQDKFSNLALYGFINELNKKHNFGCVGIESNGSHHDMDKFTFIHTIEVLVPLFNELNDIDTRSFEQLRLLGQKMEAAMFEATNGINTYKGAIFTFLLILGGLNNATYFEQGVTCIKALTKHIFDDFEVLDDKSAGQSIYQQTGIKGIREYAYEGYGILFNEVLPYYQASLDETKTYLYLISLLNDTTIIKRSNVEILHQLQDMAKQCLENNQYTYQEIESFCLKYHLSTGGSADMLAATFMLDCIQRHFDRM